jgi:flagellar motility protein MotE (MotC chaperone)
MISKLQSPLVGILLGLLSSVAIGVTFTWRALGPLVEQTIAARAAKPSNVELKQKGWDFWTIEIDELSNVLKEERAKLRKQTEALDQRTARLAAEEKELAKVRSDIEALRKEIADKVIEISADEAKNVKMLAKTYTDLSPRAAVAIFKEMDDTTAVKILSVMNSDAVGPIFEEMSHSAATDGSLARRAAVLSEKLRLMKSTKAASS